MYCKRCGEKIIDQGQFCKKCGTKVNALYNEASMTDPLITENTMDILKQNEKGEWIKRIAITAGVTVAVVFILMILALNV